MEPVAKKSGRKRKTAVPEMPIAFEPMPGDETSTAKELHHVHFFGMAAFVVLVAFCLGVNASNDLQAAAPPVTSESNEVELLATIDGLQQEVSMLEDMLDESITASANVCVPQSIDQDEAKTFPQG